MYIRVKRSKTTYFIRCKPSDKILDIKQNLEELIDEPVDNQRLILPSTGEVLEDSKTLADQKVHYYVVLYGMYYVYILFKISPFRIYPTLGTFFIYS